MSAETSIAKVIGTLSDLRFQLHSAQSGSMEPLLRAELSRLALAAERCAGTLGESQQQADAQLKEKKESVAKQAAANKEAIAAKKAEAAAAPEPIEAPDETTPIDPTLRAQLTAELLARQDPGDLPTQTMNGAGLIDDWPATPRPLVPESQLGADERVGPAAVGDRG